MSKEMEKNRMGLMVGTVLFLLSGLALAAPAPRKAVSSPAPRSAPKPAPAPVATPVPTPVPTALPSPGAVAVAPAVSAKGPAEAAPKTTVTLREVDASGKLSELSPARHGEYGWTEWPADGAPAESPKLFPTVKFTAPTAAQGLPVKKGVEPRVNAVREKEIELLVREVTGVFEFDEPMVGKEAKTQPPRRRSMIWSVNSTRPQLLSDPTCEEKGIFLDPALNGGIKWPRVAFVGVGCREAEKDSLDVMIFLPSNGKLGTTDLGVPEPVPAPKAAGASAAPIADLTAAARPRTGQPRAEGRFWKTFRVAKPHAGWRKPGRLGVFAVQENAGGAADLAVVIDPSRIPRRRFSASVGLGVTGLYYGEQPIGVSLFEVPLTLKLGMDYEFVRSMFNLHLSAYGNLFNLYKSTQAWDDSRFLGVNLRVDYQLPIPSAFKMKVGLGWYIWTMLVGNSSYGVKYLTGPEAVIGMSIPMGERRMGIGLKYAPVGSSPASFDISNFEAAVGFSFQLTPARIWPATYLTVDLSALNVGVVEGVLNKFQLYTTSLGAAVVF